ncbi:MAG: DUF4388 domain-containing protein [Nevskiaceae bacterium]|nr:DUF4388 domain-containing protein [Nevskiaceae bacterium]
MAIFGKLSDFSLREVISMIGRRPGALLLESDDGSRMHMQLSDAQIVRITLERSIESVDEAASLLKRFVQGQGSFHFDQREDDRPLAATLQLDWQRLLPPADAPSSPAQTRIKADDLPHPQTCFVLIKGRNVRLDPILDAFLQRCGAQLERGASAQQLSDELAMELEAVQWHLQSLREIKKIWPVRAYVEQSDVPKKKERRSLGQRLLGLILK